MNERWWWICAVATLVTGLTVVIVSTNSVLSLVGGGLCLGALYLAREAGR